MTLKRLLFGIIIMMMSLCLVVAGTAQEDTSDDAGLTIHVVQRDENLFRIAIQYGTTVDELVTLNGLTDATRITVGQRLLVPSGDVVPVNDTHTVQAGETLGAIAQVYGVTIEALTTANELASADAIYVGQVLTIPVANVSESAENTLPDATPPPDTTPIPEVVDEEATTLVTLSSNIHVVQAGETLFRIATNYGISVQTLSEANGINDPTVIYAGQQLVIPNLAETSETALDLPDAITNLRVSPLLMVEGETGVLEVATAGSATVSGTFLERSLAFVALDGNTRHIAFVGIPIFAESGIFTISLLVDANGVQTPFAFNMRVLTGAYGSQNLNVSDVNLTAPAVQDAEFDLLANLTDTVTLTRQWSGPFSIPAAAAMNSPFGTRRSYNGGPISAYHSGADFASAPGTSIFAAANGTVVLADTLNIRGNAVVLDHGWGIYSLYAHLTTINVALGNSVATGDIIGTAGSTGRVTGPHLHWEIWVNGVPVNPLTWTQTIFVE